MGQTLTHGVYLPDEGERNCYNGLAANWSILDGAVGTIAEHTTALSGKAPLVHTHTKSDITDFPAYGTTAGTICEGNDSRLSDARTPVAHTHTKSDVTDLFNSDNIWSANNEYKYLIGLSGAEIWFKQPNIEDITANPDVNISKSIIQIYNKTVTQYSGGITNNLRTDGSHRLVISCFGFPLNNYAGYYPHTFYFEAKRDGTASFSPSYTNASLGTSTNKWTTLNGINPGALSFPNYDDTTYIDISGSIVPPTGETKINKNLGNNQYTPPVDGWLSIRCDGAEYLQIYRNTYNCPGVTAGDGTASIKLVVTLPVRKNETYTIRIKKDGSGIENYQLYPCLGNV